MPLSPDIEGLLTKKEDELMKRINVSPMFWTKLVKHSVLTHMQVDAIKGGGHFSSQQLISALVVDYLLKGSDERYNGFLQVLLETNQEYIVTDVLKKESPTAATPSSDPQEAGEKSSRQPCLWGERLPPWSQDNQHRQMPLRKTDYHAKLMSARDKIEALMYSDDEIWPHLQTLFVVSTEQKKRLKKEKNPMEELLDFIEPKEEWRFHALLRAFAKTDNKCIINNAFGLNLDDYSEEKHPDPKK